MSPKVHVTESTIPGQSMTPSSYATGQPTGTDILPSGQGLVSPPARPFPSPALTTALTPAGYQTILKTVVEPMMMNHSLSQFRSVFEQVLLLMQQGSIPTLRDLEKMLLGQVIRPHRCGWRLRILTINSTPAEATPPPSSGCVMSFLSVAASLFICFRRLTAVDRTTYPTTLHISPRLGWEPSILHR
jgi:hypothetical protein